FSGVGGQCITMRGGAIVWVSCRASAGPGEACAGEDTMLPPDPTPSTTPHREAAREATGPYLVVMGADAAAAPRCVRDYDLLERLGQGGMGIVYKARQRGAGRLVALKVIRPDRLADLDEEQRRLWLDRFRTEALAAARLDHEHLVTVYEVGECAGVHFYSMR